MKLKFFENLPLAISLITAILVVAPDAPVWINLFSLLLIAYKLISEVKQIKPLSRGLTSFLAICLAAEIYIQYRTLFNQEASTTLLLGLTSLKIVDYETERDLKFLFLLGFVLLALKPLYTIDFYWSVPLLFCFMGLWLGLLNRPIRQKKLFFLRLFFVSIPITLLLFIIFPRFVVPWAENKSRGSGVVGFSEEMNPGQVAEIVQTNSVAFRARFFDAVDFNHNIMYWRGAVLTGSDGLSWSTSKKPKEILNEAFSASSIHYQVILEPDSKIFLFGLERTLAMTSDAFKVLKYPDSVFKRGPGATQAAYYEGFASVLSKDKELPTPENLEFTELSERADAWVSRLKIRTNDQLQRMKELDNFFRTGSFKYTLTPGTYQPGDLDEFLFKRRVGFCEHYAGAYATLARALGIPSRVVVGYQGGVYNKFGSFWKVGSKDAHAWAEVFIEGQWQRVDPTEWIAPLRLELGGEAFFEIPEEDRMSAVSIASYRASQNSPFTFWWGEVKDVVENLNYRWTSFFLEFDRSSQKDMFRKLKDNLGWGLLFIICMVLFVSGGFYALRAKAAPLIPLKRMMVDIFRFGEIRDLPRSISETPLQYLNRIKQAYPDLHQLIDKIASLYESSIYQMESTPPQAVKELHRQWKRASTQSRETNKPL